MIFFMNQSESEWDHDYVTVEKQKKKMIQECKGPFKDLSLM